MTTVETTERCGSHYQGDWHERQQCELPTDHDGRHQGSDREGQGTGHSEISNFWWA